MNNHTLGTSWLLNRRQYRVPAEFQNTTGESQSDFHVLGLHGVPIAPSTYRPPPSSISDIEPSAPPPSVQEIIDSSTAPDVPPSLNVEAPSFLPSDSTMLSMVKTGIAFPTELADPITAVVNSVTDAGLLAGSSINKYTNSSKQPNTISGAMALTDQSNYDNALMANMISGKTMGSILGPLGTILGALSGAMMTPHNNRTIATDVGNRSDTDSSLQF